MNTRELAQLLYSEWAKRMDVLEPLRDIISNDNGWAVNSVKEIDTGRTRPRPRWELLNSNQQQVWMHVVNSYQLAKDLSMKT